MADVLRVSIFGAMPNGEEWSVNPVYSIGGDFGQPVSPTQAQTIATAIAAVVVPTGVLQLMANSTNVQGCRVEARTLAGVLESQAEGIKAVPTAGAQVAVHPFQTAAVSSLRTGLPGPSGRGRLYWNGTGIPLVSATLRPSSGQVTASLTGVKTYLSGIQTAIDVTLDGVELAVWSRKLLAKNHVTSIQMGDVADVQRRRRDTLIESYATVVYP